MLKAETANAQDNLDEAQRYLRQAENTIVKLKTELKDFSKKKDSKHIKVEKENKLYVDGKEALKEQQNIEKAKKKAQQDVDYKKDLEE